MLRWARRLIALAVILLPCEAAVFWMAGLWAWAIPYSVLAFLVVLIAWLEFDV